jgi:hypothetical protein
MSRRIFVPALMIATIVGGAPLVGAEDASVGKDLKATIALQGQPCDQIVNSKRNGDSDYFVTCKDGHRYHVFVNSKGRAVVEKQ